MKSLAGLVVVWFVAVALTPAPTLAAPVVVEKPDALESDAPQQSYLGKDQTDRWTFEGNENDCVLIITEPLNSAPIEPKLHLYYQAPQGGPWELVPKQASKTGYRAYRIDHQLEKGNYRIDVNNAPYPGQGDYQITLLNLTQHDGTLIESCQTRQDKLAVAGVKVYEFTADTEDHVLIKTTSWSLTPTTLLYASGSADAVQADSPDNLSLSIPLSYILPESGSNRYEIVVINDTESIHSGEYDYSLTLLNLTKCDATSIISDVPGSGGLMRVGELDVYEFTGRKGDPVSISAVTSANLAPHFSLYPPGGGDIEAWGTTIDRHLLEQVGTYRIVANDIVEYGKDARRGTGTGDYEIMLTRFVPDLKVVALSVDPNPVIKSRPATIHWTIANTGNETAPDGYVLRIVRRSDEPGNDDADVLIEQVRIDTTIPKGGAHSGTSTFDASGAAPGSYSVVATVDADDVVSELYDDNNTQSTSISVAILPSLAAIPDVTVLAGQAWTSNVGVAGAPTPTCSLTVAPAGMTFDSATNVISWQPTSAQIGSHTVTVQATNTVGSDTRTFTISVIPAKLTISHSGPGQVTAPGEGSFPYDYGTSVPVTAAPDPDNSCAIFAGWTGTAVDAGKVVDAASPGTTVLVDGEYTLQANFALRRHTLTVLPGDRGSALPAGATSYDCGSEVSITALPGSGWRFTGWTGTAVAAGKVADPASAATTVLVDDDYTVQPAFDYCVVAPQVRTLDVAGVTVSSASLRGKLVADGNDACQCWFEYWTAEQDVPSATSMVFGKRTGESFEQSLTGLRCGTTYYYRARASNAAGSAQGSTDSFTTDPPPVHLTVSAAAGGTVTEPGIGLFSYCEAGDVPVLAEPAGPANYFWCWTGTAVDSGKIPGGDVTAPRTTVHVDANDTIRAMFLRAVVQGPDDVDRAGRRGELFSTSQLWDFCDTPPDGNDIAQDLYRVTGAAPNGRPPLPGTRLAGVDETSGASPLWWPADPYTNSGRKGLIASSGLRASINTWQSHAMATSVWLQIVWRPWDEADADLNMPAEPVLMETDPPRLAFRLLAGEFLPYGWRRTTFAWDIASSPAQVRFTLGGRILVDTLVIDTYVEKPASRGRIHVDDDAPRDPAPYDATRGDPLEDGSEYHPFDSIQEALETAPDGATIIVHEGRYAETLDFQGKDVAVVAEWLIRQDAYAPSILDAGGTGPAVRLAGGENSDCILSGLTILGGKAPDGAALLCRGGSPTISHCILCGNMATTDDGAIVACKGSDAKLIHCTIAGNRVAPSGAVLSFADSHDVMVNCIVWGNQGPAVRVVSGSPPSITYSDVEGGRPGLGVLNVDPLFAEAGSWLDAGTPDDPTDDLRAPGDYHLRSSQGRFDPAGGTWLADAAYSPCIDAGSPNGIWSQEPGPNGYRVNMGAYGGTLQAGRSTASE